MLHFAAAAAIDVKQRNNDNNNNNNNSSKEISFEMLGVYGIPANWVSERKSISKRSIRLGFFQNKILVSLVGSQ
jgi:hypothetical protein